MVFVLCFGYGVEGLILKEFLYIFAAICGVYSTLYMLFNDDWQCRFWAIFGAALTSWVAYKIHRLVIRSKNKELKNMAARTKELEIAILGDERLSSGYEPDKHI